MDKEKLINTEIDEIIFNEEPMTATELETRYRILGGQIQVEMCKMIDPFIQNLIKLIENKITPVNFDTDMNKPTL